MVDLRQRTINVGRIPRDEGALRGIEGFLNAFIRTKSLRLEQEGRDLEKELIRDKEKQFEETASVLQKLGLIPKRVAGDQPPITLGGRVAEGPPEAAGISSAEAAGIVKAPGFDIMDLIKPREGKLPGINQILGQAIQVISNPSSTKEEIEIAEKQFNKIVETRKAGATTISIGNKVQSKRALIKGELEEKGVNSEQAGKLSLLLSAQSDVNDLKKLLFPGGELDITRQIAGFIGFPAKKGRQIKSRIMNAVESKLRIESGAAVPEEEVKRMAKRFIPVPGLDNAESTMDKLNRLNTFIEDTISFLDPQGTLRNIGAPNLKSEKARLKSKFGLE